ncbi:ferric reductase-like transmembrane domain-containing protein [Oleisolibacter albus]|uniref:ferredoxin reductase family protein n=1 Tax=Oleisolibacter albus TaxID=2171757 RepID=UPI001EFEA00A|nr:ferric reductase-like transmembrane domain-containing protein [Oleisolibacter albus]
MTAIKRTFWGLLALLSLLWLAAEPQLFRTAGFFPARQLAVQYSGLIAIGCMSVAMILALRPRRPEPWLGGLDKMYRLHKWLGIGALVVALVHWLWAKGPKWAVGWGWLERPQRGPRPVAETALEQALQNLRGTAEAVGEWAFYAVVLLILMALVKRFPYRRFFQTHRLLAVTYLVLVFHAVVLTKTEYWLSPVGAVLAPLLALGSWSAVTVLLRRVGADRRVQGRITRLHPYPGTHMLEVEVELPGGAMGHWPGHRAGQFAFVTLDAAEGAHPYTIASAWPGSDRRISFIIKALGDHTSRLPALLRVGRTVTIEGPYGCFTFDDVADDGANDTANDRADDAAGDHTPHQIWIGGGVGVTPFIARMKELTTRPESPQRTIDFFHATRDHDPDFLAQLQTAADAARIRLHVLVDGRDGRLTGDRIRRAVSSWRDSSLWFCGPAGLGQALRQDFAAQGLAVERRFHQELFAMR